MTGSMNQEKIGKLIAKMRKQKDLTQRELGEMVGVGFRAVSKWERGLSMPDISIINELSEILGISSDELLKGELVPKDDNQAISTSDKDSKPVNKKNKSKTLLLIPLLLIVFIAAFLITNNNQKTIEYAVQSLHPDEYQVDGMITIDGNDLTIEINKIKFQDYLFSQIIISNCDYNVTLNNNFLFGFGNGNEYNDVNKSINDFFNTFKIDYNDCNMVSKQEYESGNLNINMFFKDINNNIIEKNIETILVKIK